ncbi:hypothetical protein CSAL01_11161 [Colletotrichum salicis]|uniref:Uncharacterized protein n=1 Tax=Colletotrichum salicis TaxID=1209931 RepID=A0A135UQL2_9PEZI|nr:hypothetical protein CSAL01_11161 [Colletotrichum salicis]
MPDIPIESKEAEESSDNSQSQSNKREHSEIPPGSPRQPSPKIYSFAFTRSFVRITGQSVYGYTCGRSKFLWKRKNVRHSHAGDEDANLPVAFLGACKQVHAEARAMLYANDFDVKGMETLAVWLKSLGTNIACLRTITLRTEPQMRLTVSSSSSFRGQQDRYREVCHRAARMLAGAENLQALGIHFFYNQMMGAPAPRATLKRPGPVSGWIGIARRVAEVLYHDFRPLSVKAAELRSSASSGRLYQSIKPLLGISWKESAIDNPQSDTALASINPYKPAEHLLKIPMRVWPRPRTPPSQTADSIDEIAKVLQSPYRKRHMLREIRNMIYEAVLASTSRVHISGELAYTFVSTKRSTFQSRRGNLTQFPFAKQVDLSILQTCKKVLVEARGIVYSRTIDVPDEETLLVWLRDIGSDNRSHLRDIALLMSSTYPQRPFISGRQKMIMTRISAMLENSPNLKRIRMDHLGFEGMIDVNKRLKLHRDGQSSPPVAASRHMAEWMFVFFRPLLCSPSFRSRSPSGLSSLLVLGDRAYDT